MPHKDPEARKAYMKQYHAQNGEKINEIRRRYRANHPEQRAKDSENARRWYFSNKERARENQKRYYEEQDGKGKQREHTERIKTRVLTHYGNGVLACVQCGENCVDCLSLDHILNNGYAERKENPRLGACFYRWLEKQGYPKDYQTLCMNCNWKKRRQRERDTASACIKSGSVLHAHAS